MGALIRVEWFAVCCSAISLYWTILAIDVGRFVVVVGRRVGGWKVLLCAQMVIADETTSCVHTAEAGSKK